MLLRLVAPRGLAIRAVSDCMLRAQCRRKVALSLLAAQEYLVPPKRYALSYTLMLPVADESRRSATADTAQKLWRQAMAETADIDSIDRL